jgi:hypothetical protein
MSQRAGVRGRRYHAGADDDCKRPGMRDAQPMGGGHRTAPAAPPPAKTPPAGDDAACRRLELRAVRLERVVAALRSQAGQYGPSAPPPLRRAIRDYQAELAAVRRRLSS